MLYIFDLGNVIVDIDFNRVLGTWSDLSVSRSRRSSSISLWARRSISTNAVKLAMRAFAQAMCHEMNMPLSYEQFPTAGRPFCLCALTSSRLCKTA